MAKPVISFFTFPKFLLWSLPLFFLLIAAWLKGGLNVNTISAFLTRVESVEQQVASHVSLKFYVNIRQQLQSDCDVSMSVKDVDCPVKLATLNHTILLSLPRQLRTRTVNKDLLSIAASPETDAS